MAGVLGNRSGRGDHTAEGERRSGRRGLRWGRQLGALGAGLCLVGGFALVGAPAAGAAVPHATSTTYYVGSTGDSTAAVSAATCESATNTTCTLRDAVGLANADGVGSTDTISFSALVSPATVTLTPANGPIQVSDAGTLSITGQGMGATTISGDAGTEVFSVAGPAVTISDLTITAGKSTGNGGGIDNTGTLTLSDVAVSGNTTGAAGGGIWNSGTLSATDITVDDDVADQSGGGIENDQGTLSVSGGTFTNDVSSGNDGGALYSFGSSSIHASATLTRVTMDDNTSEYGGAIENVGANTAAEAVLTLTDSTLAGNFVRDYDDGGGLYNERGQATLTNDTIVDNAVTEYGGGIANEGGSVLTLTNDTIADNNALQAGGGIYNDGSTLNIQGSILAGNQNYTVANQCLGYSAITDLGYNVVGPQADGSCRFGATGDLTGANPQLGALAANGGPTQTMALAPTSPALHRVPLADCPATDQRGVSRPQPTGATMCDAGAFELGTIPPAYDLVSGGGGVFSFGAATFHGSVPESGAMVGNVVGMARTPGGYWLATANGGVFSFGAAQFHGSAPAAGISVSDVVGIAATPDGGGYWLVGSDGGVFAFGDASFEGSLPAMGVATSDIVGIAAAPGGGGYWLVGAHGGVFAFGAARYDGSLPAMGVATSDIAGIAATPDGGGYWLVGAHGGVFAFGNARYDGSLPALGVSVSDIAGIAATPDGGGYWLVGKDGGIFSFGNAAFAGSLPQDSVHVGNVVGIA